MVISSTSTVRSVKPARWRRFEASRGSAMGEIRGETPPLWFISANCKAVLRVQCGK